MTDTASTYQSTIPISDQARDIARAFIAERFRMIDANLRMRIRGRPLPFLPAAPDKPPDLDLP